VVDFVHLEDGLRDRFIKVAHGNHYDIDIEHHVDLIMMGNDTIYGGDGNDLIFGDDFVLRAPAVTLVAGGSTAHYDHDPANDWLSDERWNDHGERSSWWKSWDFGDYYCGRQDLIEAGADTIYGGAGNDLIWGDSIALITSTINRGPGISNGDFGNARDEVREALQGLTALTDEMDYWLEFSEHGHDHRDDHWTWATAADGNWERGHHHDCDDGDTIFGGDGDDVIYGQDGRDSLHGDAGNDWLIAGDDDWGDLLDGGAGKNKLVHDDYNGKDLRDLVNAAMPTWSGAFSGIGLSVVPFASNTAPLPGHDSFDDFDFLAFNCSPWDGHSPVWQTAVGGDISSNVALLTNDQLLPIVTEAKLLWTQALGVGDSRLAVLDTVEVTAGNLPEGRIGATVGNEIVIDSTAAGRGWFVDPTPGDNSEFAATGAPGALQAVAGSAAFGRMDLLSTVLHELGNAMGFKEDQGHDVMSDTLAPGIRFVLTPSPQHDTDAIKSQLLAAAISQGALLEHHWMPEFGDGAPNVHDQGLANLLEEFDWSSLDKALSSDAGRRSVDWNSPFFTTLWSPFAGPAHAGADTGVSPNMPDFTLSLLKPEAHDANVANSVEAPSKGIDALASLFRRTDSGAGARAPGLDRDHANWG
jgi:hypothetical protein